MDQTESKETGFFDREHELDSLRERVREGAHTLLTAQRRVGKTNLVRELQRRLADAGEVDTLRSESPKRCAYGDTAAYDGYCRKCRP